MTITANPPSLKQLKLDRLRTLRALRAEKEHRQHAEARRKITRNRERWPSPLDMGAELDPPRVGDDGERMGVWRTPPST